MGGGALKTFMGIFKKASKVKSKIPKAGGVPMPKGIKIGIFGHSAVGKTTYLSILFGHIRNKQGAHMFESRDALTARELLDNWNAIQGITSAAEQGRRVERRVDAHFPSGTTADKPLELLCRRGSFRSVRFFCLDYKGESVAIETPDDMREELAEFFEACDAIVFLIERDVVSSPELSRRHLAPFVNYLNRAVEQSGRSRIPVALVVTKSDVWEEFISEEQVEALTGSAAAARGQAFHRLWNRVTNLPRLRRFPKWDRCLSQIGENIRPFIEAAKELTLQYQVFFVSATGSLKTGNVPPEQIRPIGLERPFLWVLDRARRRRGFVKMRKIAKWTFILGICWALIVSFTQMYTWKWSSRGPSEWSESWLDDKSPSRKKGRYERFEGKWYNSAIFGLSEIGDVARSRVRELRGSVDPAADEPGEIVVDTEDESPECKNVLNSIGAFMNGIKGKMSDPRYLSESATAEADQMMATIQGGQGNCSEDMQRNLTGWLSRLTEYKNGIDAWKDRVELRISLVQIGDDRGQGLDVKIAGEIHSITEAPQRYAWSYDQPWAFELIAVGGSGIAGAVDEFRVDDPVELLESAGKNYVVDFPSEKVTIKIEAPTPWPSAP